MSQRRDSYDLARPVSCYRGPMRYDAEISVMWLHKQWVVKKGCVSHDEAISIAKAGVDLLHTKIEELVLAEMKQYKGAEE